MLLSKYGNYNRPAETIALQYRAIQQFNVAEELLMINHKVLIIHGTNDALLPYQNTELLHNKIKYSQVILLTNAGHMFWLMELEKTASIVKNFLKQDLNSSL